MPVPPEQSNELPYIPLMQHRFRGLNLYVPPDGMEPDELRIADNVYIKGWKPTTRPGLVGQLTTKFGQALYAPVEYIRPDGTTNILFTTGGKLYQFTKGNTAASEVLQNGTTSFNLISSQTRIVRQGKYAYVVDGQQNLTDLVIQSTNTQVSSATHTFQQGDVGKTLTVTSGTGNNYTDLVIDGSVNTKVTSVGRPFIAADIGGTLQVTSGTGWTVQTVTVTNVVAGAATLSASAGTLGSTGGHATFTVPNGLAGFTLGLYTISTVATGIATLSAAVGTANSTGGQGTLKSQLYRVTLFSNNAYTATATTALTAPGQPSVTLTSSTIDAVSDATLWSSFPTLNTVLTAATSNETITNSTYAGITATDTDPPPDGWQTGGDSMDDGNQANSPDFDAGAGPSWIDWCTPSATYATTIQTYTDMVIGASNTLLTSATRTFRSTDVGSLLLITSGTNFTRGLYGITAVSATGIATVDRAIGTTTSTGGHGILTASDSTIRYNRVWVARNQINGTGQINMQFFPEWSGNAANNTQASTGTVQGLVQVTDLAIDGSNKLKVTSASYTFLATGGPTNKGDIGKVLTITAGTNFNLGGHTITSVSGGAAFLASSSLGAGTTGSTAGTAYMSFDCSQNAAGGWGQTNTTLQTPPSNGSNGAGTPLGYQDYPYNVTGNSVQQNTRVVSFTGLAKDPEEARFRQWGPASNTPTRSSTPSFQYVDVRLKTEASAAGTVHVKANNTLGGYCLGNSYIRRAYGGTVTTVSDLAIDGSNNLLVSSASYNFVAGDVGRYVAVLGASASGWTVGNYKIASVATNKATLATSPGTTSSTGGVAQVVSVQNYSTSNTIAIFYTAPASSGTIPFRLGIQQPGQNPSGITWTQPGTQVTDSSGTYLSFDVSTISSTIRAQTQYLYLQITSDLPSSVNLDDLFTFGPISSAGNLSIGFSDYSYVLTEVNDSAYTAAGVATGNTTDGVIESNGGLSSVNVTPTGAKAEGQITVSTTPVNASTNYYYLYRFGGVFPSEDVIPTGRLIAKIPLWTNTLDTAYSTWVTWNHTSGVIVDNTPDSAIYTAVTLAADRGPAPYGGQCLADWQGRLAVAAGSLLAVGWLVGNNQAAALYFNVNNFPNDPYGALKGVQVTVGGYDNDNIQALIPFGTSLLIMKQRSIWVLVGTDGTNFQLSQLFPRAGVGLLAPIGWALVGNTIWFLGPQGIFTFDGTGPPVAISKEIDDYLYPPQISQPAIAGALYANGAAIYHGRRFYLFMPMAAYNFVDLQIGSTNTTIYSASRPFLPGDVGKTLTISGGTGFTVSTPTINSVAQGIATLSGSAGTALSTAGTGSITADTGNTVADVYDTRQGGWTRFLNMNVTGACSLSSQGDTDDLYLAGSDGQLYQLSYAQQGDVDHAGASATAIGGMVRSRGFGREAEGTPWWQQNRGLRTLAKIYLGEVATQRLETGAVGSYLTWSINHTAPSTAVPNYQYYKDDIRRDMVGDAFYAQVSWSTITPVVVAAVGVDLAKGKLRSTL